MFSILTVIHGGGKNTTCCLSQNITVISEINVQNNIYVSFNVTNIPTIYITRCHISYKSRFRSDLSSEVAILYLLLLLCFSFCCLLLSSLHLTSKTSPVKLCGWYYNVISLKLLQIKFLRLSVNDALSVFSCLKPTYFFCFFLKKK